MLPGEGAKIGNEAEAAALELEAGLGFGHFVKGLDGNEWVFAPELEEEDPAAGFEGSMEGCEHFGGVGELVVGIDHQGGVEGRGRELQIVDRTEVGFHICDLELVGALAEEIEHLGLDVDGDDFALRDFWGDTKTVVAGACTDVRDHGVGFQFDGGDGFCRGFLLFAIAAFQPIEARVAHDLGDFAAVEELADAIGRGLAMRVGRCCRRCGYWQRLGGWGAGSENEKASGEGGAGESDRKGGAGHGRH